MSDPYFNAMLQQQNKLENNIKRLYDLVFKNQEFINILIDILKIHKEYDYDYNSCPGHHNSQRLCSLCKWFEENADEKNNVKEILKIKIFDANQIMKKFNEKHNSVLKICIKENKWLNFELKNDIPVSDVYIKLETYKIINNVMKPVSKEVVIETLKKSCYFVSADVISPDDTIPFYNIRMMTSNPDQIISEYGHKYTMSKTSFSS